MSVVGALLLWVLYLFALCMIVRLIIGWVLVFARSWEPRSVMLVVVETAYTVTDPPLKLLRRYIPPLRLGGVGVGVAFLIPGIIGFLLVPGAATPWPGNVFANARDHA